MIMADTIPGNTTSTQSLAIGTSAFNAIDYLGDTDWWKVYLTYGYQYQVWIEGSTRSPGTLVDPYLAVYNGNGTFAFANDDASRPRLRRDPRLFHYQAAGLRTAKNLVLDILLVTSACLNAKVCSCLSYPTVLRVFTRFPLLRAGC